MQSGIAEKLLFGDYTVIEIADGGFDPSVFGKTKLENHSRNFRSSTGDTQYDLFLFEASAD